MNASEAHPKFIQKDLKVMKITIVSALVMFFSVSVSPAGAQTQPNGQFPPEANPMYTISTELVSISNSVKTLNQNMKVFLDKLGGPSATPDKQQKMLTGLQLLTQAEQRLATLQRSQIDLAEKQAQIRARLIQIDQDLRPESIDRSVAFAGTTRTDELRDSRRRALEVERNGMRELIVNVESTLTQTSSDVRDALALVVKLRKRYLAQVEQQLNEMDR